MIFTDVQAFFASRLAADPALTPLPTRLYQPFQDPQAAKSDINTKLRASGVCLQVGFPEILEVTEAIISGVSNVEVGCAIDIAEHPDVAHAPYLIGLVNEVIIACTAKQQNGQKPARLAHTPPPFKTEEGYIVHTLIFYVQLMINPSSTLAGKTLVDSRGGNLVDSRGGNIAHS